MAYILSLDQGTTSSRAILFDRSGRIVSVAQKEFRQIFPRPGWVEHQPDEIWSSQLSVASEALSKKDINADEVSAIGITNQRETTIVWNRNTGKPLCNAIVWQDRRTSDMCSGLKREGYEELFRQKTGLVLDPYFSGTKIRWILEHTDGARKLAENGDLLFGTVDCWLLWKLTGGNKHITDVTNASRTLLFNIHQLEWDRELLGILEIPESMLPEVHSNSELYGETGQDLFSTPIPIAGMAGDQHAALFGQMCSQPGMAKNTYGTGCFMLMQTGETAIESTNNLLTTIAWQVNGETCYALEGSVFIGGAVVQWIRDGLGLISRSDEIEKIAAEVPDTDGLVMVPAFAGLGAPHWDPYARGVMIGLTRGTRPPHICRAALESIACQSYDLLHAMESDSGIKLRELRVDGGASVNNLLMQFQADLLDVPVVRPAITETTALGAAFLAGLAVGFWKDRQEIESQWQPEKVYKPDMVSTRRSALLKQWHKAVERSKNWVVEG
ncbi:MAG: glycerol kinase GlpK [Balneolaceae bacterium]